MQVLLVDDNRLMLEGLANLLDAHGLQVTGLARDGLEAIELSRSLKPDVILMDIRMPRCDGLAATRLIKAAMPEVSIIMLTTSTEDADLFEAVKSGACGYLLKSMNADELVECLELVQQGIPPFSPGLATKLLHEFARISNENSQAHNGTKSANEVKGQVVQDQLTDREREVLTLVAQGLSYKEVGTKLSLSPRTIKYHMSEVMDKLHLTNRAQVLAYAGKMII